MRRKQIDTGDYLFFTTYTSPKVINARQATFPHGSFWQAKLMSSDNFEIFSTHVTTFHNLRTTLMTDGNDILTTLKTIGEDTLMTETTSGEDTLTTPCCDS
jgi:hypothetical protein